MKKAAALIVVALLILSLTGCSQDTEDIRTFSGTAPGRNGDVAVVVDIGKDSTILEVRVKAHSESAGITDYALDYLPREIVLRQTLDIQAVSGATITSNAVLAAAADALSKAGVAPSGLKSDASETPVPSEKLSLEADVVIVGTGAAAFAAAVSAAEHGGSVIMVEKMPYIGGNSLRASGTTNAVDPDRQTPYGIRDSTELFYKQTYEAGGELADPALVRTLVENALDVRVWLESYGAKLGDKAFQTTGGLWPRSINPAEGNTGSDIFVYNMEKYVTASGGIILSDTRVERILTEDGTVCGVYARNEKASTEYTISARRGVVLATGGYAANADMLRTFNDLTPLNTSNHPGATGDGITLAADVGAQLVGMEYIQLHPFGDPRTGALRNGGSIRSTIYVNTEGKRFVNEEASWRDITSAQLMQPNSAMYSVFDDTQLSGSAGLQKDLANGDVLCGATLDELAQKMGVSADVLKATLETYNANLSSDEFGKSACKAIEKAPFYAVLITPTIHYTMGGVRIDESARVIGMNGEPIQGFFAAGEVTGGVHGSNRIGGNGLTDAVVFGRIAGCRAMGGGETETSDEIADN